MQSNFDVVKVTKRREQNKINRNLFCISLGLHYSDLAAEDRLHLGKTKKNKFSFGFSLGLHYLCGQNDEESNIDRHFGSSAVASKGTAGTATGGGNGSGRDGDAVPDGLGVRRKHRQYAGVRRTVPLQLQHRQPAVL